MIELAPEAMIGKGLHRECYVHPDDDNKCIKVVVLRGEEETRREQAYYRLLQKKAIDWRLLPKFYGVVATSLGDGAVFDLIRDHAGPVAKPLDHYLENEALTQSNLKGLTSALIELKAYLIEQNVMTMTLKPKNIVYQRINEQQGNAIIIDNIGNSDAIAISSHCRYFGRKKIERKWARFIKLLQRDYADNQAVQAMLTDI